MQTEIFDNTDPENCNETPKEAAYRNILEEIIDIAILDICFEVHRSAKLGFFFKEDLTGGEKYEIEGKDSTDIFGNESSKMKFPLINCPKCKSKQEATRFAPHLGKCMGKGRLSSRLANKKFANVYALDSDDDDYENGSDFINNSKKRAKNKQGKNSRRITKIRGKSREKIVNTSESLAKYQEMTYAERKTFLNQMCGVISKHTKKMCARTLKCSQHTDEQRRDIRSMLLGRGYMTDQLADDVQIDVDTVDGSYITDQLADDVQIDVDTVDEENGSLNFGDLTISRSPSPVENIPTSHNFKKEEKKPLIMSRNTVAYFRKRKASLGPSNSVSSSHQGTSAGSSFDAV